MKRPHFNVLHGIRRRWLFNSLGVAMLIVLVGVAAFSVAVSNYYYSAAGANIMSKATTAASFFSKYMQNSYYEYYDTISRFTADFKDRAKLELQFVSYFGRVESSTAGPAVGLRPQTKDVEEALQTRVVSSWVGTDPVTDERVMSVSAPIIFANDQVIGVMRYISSMRDIDRQILMMVLVAFAIGAVFIVFVIVSNLFFIRTIVEPVEDITKIARKIADGSYGARIEKTYDDEIGDLTDTINHMSAEIMTAERIKTEFMSSVSHELRTPLTAISGWGQTLLSGEVTNLGEIKKGVRIMLKEADRLSKMVEELLDFTRIEGGRLTLQMAEMDLTAELEEVAYLYMDLLSREDIALHCNTEDDLPPMMGDRARLKQVLINLIDNAAKHGGEGKRIDVTLRREEETFVFSVRDYGPGIPADELPHVKYKFYKGSSKARGNGIGLAVTDEIVHLHGGDLILQSVVGEGTEAIVRLPIRLGS